MNRSRGGFVSLGLIVLFVLAVMVLAQSARERDQLHHYQNQHLLLLQGRELVLSAQYLQPGQDVTVGPWTIRVLADPLGKRCQVSHPFIHYTAVFAPELVSEDVHFIAQP